MKIAVISDTHGVLRTEVMQALEGCDCILHGGDIGDEAVLIELRKIATVYAVRGNNDRGPWAEELARELTVNLGGYRFYMIHDQKEQTEKAEGADFAIYGHSHRYASEMRGDTLWLNPGSCGRRRFKLPLTFAMLELTRAGYRLQRREI
ncbi:metallophosphoesterase family protein [Bianquea renquensis]|jgi:phosphodiesterase family protein|uniref:Phosphoesterase n=1 Tax=Bianquea renquensis TaxID=2763661 RepID=A0A926DQB6_9FIRM|nr:metallophosphoesterase family protein [Bianquea renquensis]MBC8542113.1 metallophosphoesterase family protein [Bianquea renquensis]